MKVKSAIISNGLQIIYDLAEKPMPVALAAKLLRLGDDLSKEANIIEKQRQLIIEKYGDKDENGQLIVTDGQVTFKDRSISEEANKELVELANLEVDIKDRGITEEELIQANLQLTLTQFATLRSFLQENNVEVVEE